MIDLRRFRDVNREQQRTKLQREIGIMTKCTHRNIVDLLGHFESTGNHKIYLFLELCAGGTLGDFIERKQKLNESTAQSFSRQIASGLKYLHSMGIIHRDLKPQNILLSECSVNAIVRIADFGESRIKQKVMDQTMLETYAGTPRYMAPELLMVNVKIGDEQQYGAKGIFWIFITLRNKTAKFIGL